MFHISPRNNIVLNIILIPKLQAKGSAIASLITQTITAFAQVMIAYKIFKQVVPWPFRLLAFKDNGVALMDPEHLHAREPFVPTRLVDARGNDCAPDGFPYIEKYKEII